MDWYKALIKSANEIVSKRTSRHGVTKRLSNYNKKRIGVLAKYLRKETYQFAEWKPSCLPKKDGGQRVIIVPPFYDRVVLRALSSYLFHQLKQSFSEVEEISYAYQKNKGVREALIRLKSIYTTGSVVLKVDIRKFFDNIDKRILSVLLDSHGIENYIRSLIDQSLYPKLKINDYFDDAMTQIKNGIPQGNAISAILSNLILHELDVQSKTKGLKMVRYADDMVFVCKNMEQANSILSWVKNYLKSQRNLDIHPLGSEKDAKTQIISNLKKNKLKFLGVEFDGERLLPTKECRDRLIAKIRSVVQSEVSAAEKIVEINICINQWCGYYAFTDIPDNHIQSLGNKINQLCEFTFKDVEWKSIDLVQKIKKFKEKQSRKGLKRVLPPAKFDDKYNWLMIYD